MATARKVLNYYAPSERKCDIRSADAKAAFEADGKIPFGGSVSSELRSLLSSARNGQAETWQINE
jgi:hypothetical protein